MKLSLKSGISHTSNTKKCLFFYTALKKYPQGIVLKTGYLRTSTFSELFENFVFGARNSRKVPGKFRRKYIKNEYFSEKAEFWGHKWINDDEYKQ